MCKNTFNLIQNNAEQIVSSIDNHHGDHFHIEIYRGSIRKLHFSRIPRLILLQVV